MTGQLPKFRKPPVVEVALSVQFERLPTTIQLALSWEKFRDRFPSIQEHPELESTVERFGVIAPPTIQFSVNPISAPRLWFVNTDNSELIQVQRDRFIRNWRKTNDGSDYPSYEKLRVAFEDDWKVFEQFISDNGCQLHPNQCELTYVNIIEDVDLGQMDQIFKFLEPAKTSVLENPEDLNFNVRYRMNNGDGQPVGRLHVSAHSAVRVPDNKPGIRFTLTARGAPAERNLAGAQQFLDHAHEAIVKSFAELTMDSMHKTWERTQ